MEPHTFEEAGTAHEVHFYLIRGRWLATLNGRGAGDPVLLAPASWRDRRAMSDEARRAGFIAVAK
jgi:hypothetical protein